MKCAPCRGGVPPLTAEEIAPLLAQTPGWEVVNGHHLHRRVDADDFLRPLKLANRIGKIAEEAGHHPDLLVAYGRLEIDIFTHRIDGLTKNDFILAARIDDVLKRKSDRRSSKT